MLRRLVGREPRVLRLPLAFHGDAGARKVLGLGWPKRRKLARAFMWEHSDKSLGLAQLLDLLGVFLTCRSDVLIFSRMYWEYMVVLKANVASLSLDVFPEEPNFRQPRHPLRRHPEAGLAVVHLDPEPPLQRERR
jgi:hypothetical protein